MVDRYNATLSLVASFWYFWRDICRLAGGEPVGGYLQGGVELGFTVEQLQVLVRKVHEPGASGFHVRRRNH